MILSKFNFINKLIIVFLYVKIVMDKFKSKYRIPSTRLQNWNYGWNGKYFVTICTYGREWFFGKIQNSEMILSEIGYMASHYWYSIPEHFPFVILDAFVVMPNHIHGIIIINKSYTDQQAEKLGRNKYHRDHHNVETRQCLVSTARKCFYGTTDLYGNRNFEGDYSTDIPNNSHNDFNRNQPGKSKHNTFKYTPGQQRYRNPEKNSLSSIIGSYKSIVSRMAHLQYPRFEWQSRFDDRIIRNDKSYYAIRTYINNNPQNWDTDCFNTLP
jgi:REP element-mobilizing transposase RayT